MAIKKLTQKSLEAAKPGSHVIRLRDGNVKGFHLVIHPNGTSSFYYFGYFAAEEEVFNLQAWRTEVEGLVAGINDAPDLSKYLKRDED